jgi:hypothetical protein
VDARLVVFDGLPQAFWAYMGGAASEHLMARFIRERMK